MNTLSMRTSLSRSGIASALALAASCYAAAAVAQQGPDQNAAPADEAMAAGAEQGPASGQLAPGAQQAAVPGADLEALAPPEAAEGAPATVQAPPASAEVDATAAAQADAEAAAVEAELLAGGGGASAAEVVDSLTGEETKLSIYGFADFTYHRLLSKRREYNNYPFAYPSFYVGNFNVYLSSKLGQNLRALSEVRFTYLPDGADVTDLETYEVTRTSTAYPDYTDFNRPVDVGGVIIERVWVEYTAHPLLTARFGQWLTPYGIWNVDHGSPTIISTTRPFIIGAEMFPQRQTGVQLHGSQGFESTQVGYNLTLSNGRGPIDSYRDMDKNKAFGWRVWAQQDTGIGTFVLGTSGYKGTFTDRTQTIVADISDPENVVLSNEFVTNAEFDELSLAADFKWTWAGAVLQGEVIMSDKAFPDESRPAVVAMDMGPAGWAPDTRTWGVYGLGGYRFDFLGIMPFFGGEYMSQGRSNLVPGAAALHGGINVRPTAPLVVKVQGTYAFYPDDWPNVEEPEPLKMLISQIAWSF